MVVFVMPYTLPYVRGVYSGPLRRPSDHALFGPVVRAPGHRSSDEAGVASAAGDEKFNRRGGGRLRASQGLDGQEGIVFRADAEGRRRNGRQKGERAGASVIIVGVPKSVQRGSGGVVELVEG